MVLTFAPRLVRGNRLERALREGEGSTAQTTVRLTVLLLLLLLAVAEEFGLDVVLAAFFMLLLVVRGVPALFLYRRDLPAVRRVQLMLLTATALPLLVALAEIGLRNGTMLRENAATLVGARPLGPGMSNLPRFRALPP